MQNLESAEKAVSLYVFVQGKIKGTGWYQAETLCAAVLAINKYASFPACCGPMFYSNTLNVAIQMTEFQWHGKKQEH